MNLVELSNYSLPPVGTGKGLKDINFEISAGDLCAIQSDMPDDAKLFLRAIATLDSPTRGKYLFKGEELDFSDYRNLLFCKKKIAYIAPDTALLSNRTLRENLLFMRYYYENSLSIELDKNTERMCRMFGIAHKLDMPAAKAGQLDQQITITIRELAKIPDILLLERPEDFIGQAKIWPFLKIMKKLIAADVPVVFFSFDNTFIEQYSNRVLLIQDGHLSTVDR